MTIYTVKWTETHTYEVDVEADGPEEALEEFWLLYPDYLGLEDAVTDIDGPQDVTVRWFKGVVTK